MSGQDNKSQSVHPVQYNDFQWQEAEVIGWQTLQAEHRIVGNRIGSDNQMQRFQREITQKSKIP